MREGIQVHSQYNPDMQEGVKNGETVWELEAPC